MKIELCVSVPNGGANYVELMCQTINRTKSGLHEISLRFTCHNVEQQRIIQDCCSNIQVSGYHIIERIKNTFLHSNSVTHSKCIEAMYQATSADICIICDYDCILVKKDWDEEIARQINIEGVVLLGSPYSETPLRLFGNIDAFKYQFQPNAIFLAINISKYKEVTSSLCNFSYEYGDPTSIPLKLISNPLEGSRYGLEIGTFLNIDTGSLIPSVVASNRLKTKVLDRRISGYQIISLNPLGLDPILAPEEYYLDGNPFAVHFRKAAHTSVKINSYGFDKFKVDIENYLKKMMI